MDEAEIEFRNGIRAVLSSDYGWKCGDARLARVLNNTYSFGCLPASSHSPVTDLAVQVANDFHARIIRIPVLEST
jgi:hypothetical protein